MIGISTFSNAPMDKYISCILGVWSQFSKGTYSVYTSYCGVDFQNYRIQSYMDTANSYYIFVHGIYAYLDV